MMWMVLVSTLPSLKFVLNNNKKTAVATVALFRPVFSNSLNEVVIPESTVDGFSIIHSLPEVGAPLSF